MSGNRRPRDLGKGREPVEGRLGSDVWGERLEITSAFEPVVSLSIFPPFTLLSLTFRLPVSKAFRYWPYTMTIHVQTGRTIHSTPPAPQENLPVGETNQTPALCPEIVGVKLASGDSGVPALGHARSAIAPFHCPSQFSTCRFASWA